MATNLVVLEGLVVSRDAIRQTPGGIAILNLTLKHVSTQLECGNEVQVEAEINAVAFGDIAEALHQLRLNDAITVKGFLGRKYRNYNTLILHITQFKSS
jgi:primosomal replication protein N